MNGTDASQSKLFVRRATRVVGYGATFCIAEALVPHGWRKITGGGYASRHDPNGGWLYGMEVCVDPERRGLRIGRRLYDRRHDFLPDHREAAQLTCATRNRTWPTRLN